MKNIQHSYHPMFIMGFHLNILPADLKTQIPLSTRHEWSHRNQQEQFGYQWSAENKHIEDLVRLTAENKMFRLTVIKLLRIIVLLKQYRKQAQSLKEKNQEMIRTFLNGFSGIKDIFGLKKTLSLFGLSYSEYYIFKSQKHCGKSVLNLCLLKHPAQLLPGEVQTLSEYLLNPAYIFWPLSSVYSQIVKDGKGTFCKSLFYKYASKLNIKRRKARNRRKNHQKGLRARHPLEYIHADVTLLRTADNMLAYIYVVVDNYSRAILGLRIELEKKAAHMFDCLKEVYEKHIKRNETSSILITDDGSENQGKVSELINDEMYKKHWIAQKDILFSNSMVESTNMQLKYYDLYTRDFADFNALKAYEQQMKDNHNNRPRVYLDHLTPIEVLTGKQTDQQARKQWMNEAKNERLKANRLQACLYPTC